MALVRQRPSKMDNSICLMYVRLNHFDMNNHESYFYNLAFILSSLNFETFPVNAFSIFFTSSFTFLLSSFTFYLDFSSITYSLGSQALVIRWSANETLFFYLFFFFQGTAGFIYCIEINSFGFSGLGISGVDTETSGIDTPRICLRWQWIKSPYSFQDSYDFLDQFSSSYCPSQSSLIGQIIAASLLLASYLDYTIFVGCWTIDVC